MCPYIVRLSVVLVLDLFTPIHAIRVMEILLLNYYVLESDGSTYIIA